MLRDYMMCRIFFLLSENIAFLFVFWWWLLNVSIILCSIQKCFKNVLYLFSEVWASPFRDSQPRDVCLLGHLTWHFPHGCFFPSFSENILFLFVLDHGSQLMYFYSTKKNKKNKKSWYFLCAMRWETLRMSNICKIHIQHLETRKFPFHDLFYRILFVEPSNLVIYLYRNLSFSI